MKLTFDKTIPKLTFDKFELTGWDVSSMPPKYPNQDAIVFSNDVDDKYIETNLYELIKHLTINDFVNSKIEFIISPYLLGNEPKILEKLPYPFFELKVGIEQHNFKIILNALQDIGYDENWDKKWTNEFYFENFSKALKDNNEIQISFDKDMFLSLEISYKSDSKNVEDAVEKTLEKVTELIKKVEATFNGLSGFFEVLDIWKNKKTQKSEIFWHKLLKKYSWLLSLIINEPTIMLDDEAYVGGKTIQNKKGNVIDFIFKNQLSDNLALIEIKTPQAKLIGKSYRNTFTLSSELTGSINQLLNYKDSFQKNYYSINNNSDTQFDLISPSSYLIIGNQENLTKPEKECFELYRKNLNGITIITFNELFEKAFFILNMMNN